jgi:hypothetical protein
LNPIETHWIDKVEVARRQIIEAVLLFFERRDAVVIHTIIASAHQVLFDIGRKRDVRSVLKSRAPKDTELQRYLKSINYPYNFFKHADRDLNGKINIGPLERFTGDFIMDAIMMLQQLVGDIPTEAKVFWFWFVSKNPEGFENLPEDSEIRRMQQARLADWNFAKIRQFLSFCDIVQGKGDISERRLTKRPGRG